jgi:toxin ParE1/3/4
MNQYRVSQAAQADLDEIWFYIAQDNPDAADGFIREIASRFPKPALMRELGRQRRELSGRLRSFAVGHYVIFYFRGDGGIEVARVLHGSRNLPPLF